MGARAASLLLPTATSSVHWINWLTVSTRATIAAPALLNEVLQAFAESTRPTRTVRSLLGISGIDAAVLRVQPFHRVVGFYRTYRGDVGLPPGVFQAKVSTIEQNID